MGTELDLRTELKTKSQLAYFKKKIETNTGVKIKRIRQEVRPLEFYKVNMIMGEFMVKDTNKYFAILAFKFKEEFRKNTANLIKQIKEIVKQNT